MEKKCNLHKNIKWLFHLVIFIPIFDSYGSFIDDAKRWAEIKKSDLEECGSDPKGETCIDLAKKRDLGYQTQENSNYLSVELLTISCKKGNSKGCELLKTFTANQEKAIQCYEDFDTGEKCFQPGIFHKGLFKIKSNPDDLRYAAYFFKKACERNHVKGCEENSKINKLASTSNVIYPKSGSSITLSTHTDGVMGILIRGEITKGDFEEFESIVKRYKGKLSTVYLDSPGGDAIESMKIGRLINKLNLRTWAPGGSPEMPVCFGQNKEEQGKLCTCMSSCFLIHLAGKMRFGEILGIHRIYPAHEILKSLSAEEAKKLHDMIKVETKKYVSEMGAPEELTNMILSIPSNKIQYLSKVEIEKYVPHISHEYQEWILAKCGDQSSIYRKETKWLNENKHRYQNLPTMGEVISKFPEYKKIKEELDKNVECENKILELVQKDAYIKTYK